jgi:tetratricopeptide (TPR) repeat protein
MIAKTRPAVVLIADNLDAPRSLIIHIPVTRQNRGSELEVRSATCRFLTPNGIRVAKDEDEAAKWFLKSAEQGQVDAQTQLGLIKLIFKQEYADADKWLQKAAEKDDAEAEYMLGLMRLYGWGMEKDYVEAAKWIQRSAEHGSTEAQINIGVMYHRGQGVEKDYTEAYAWWNLAARNSTARSIFDCTSAQIRPYCDGQRLFHHGRWLFDFKLSCGQGCDENSSSHERQNG